MSLILVADDESHIVQVLALKFRNAGHDVIEATDGEEALDLVRGHRPDVVVTDMQMPFMNGIELAGAGIELAGARRADVPARSLAGFSSFPSPSARPRPELRF